MLDESVFRASNLCVVGNLNRDVKLASVTPGDYLFADGETPAVRQILPGVNLAHSNVRELNEFIGVTAIETSLHRLEECGVEAVVVHLGSDGARFYERGKLVVEKPVPVTRYVNAAGTGDVLSVFMMLLDRNKDVRVEEKLRLANQAVCDFTEGKRTLIPSLA